MTIHRVQRHFDVAGAVLGVFGGADLLLAPSSSRHQRLVAGLLLWGGGGGAIRSRGCYGAGSPLEIPTKEHVPGCFLGGVSGSSLTLRFGMREE
jgi:hypothetical protein